MKKLSVVNHKLVNNVKTSVKEVKAMAGQRQTMTIKKGDVNVLPGTALKAFDFNAVATANHAFKADNDIVWDFESEDQLADWMVLDNDGDGFNWQYFNNEGKETGLMTAHSGYGLMASASYDNGTGAALTPDNWLISPVVTLGKSVKLWACGQDASYAAEKFGVFVCIGDPTNINDFVQVGADKTVTGTMTEYGFDLSEYEGQQGCIAIRHYNVTDMFFLNIDDVTISGDEYIPEPEPVAPEVITEIPEGCQVYTYFRNSATIYSSIFGIGGGETDGKFTVAFDVANHEVYIQNPVWYYDGYSTWVKGTYTYGEEGVIITIPTGQYLFWNDSYQYGIVLGMGSTYVYEEVDPETGESGYYLGTELDERATEIQFMIDDDTIYLLNTEGDINAEFPENYNAYGL